MSKYSVLVFFGVMLLWLVPPEKDADVEAFGEFCNDSFIIQQLPHILKLHDFDSYLAQMTVTLRPKYPAQSYRILPTLPNSGGLAVDAAAAAAAAATAFLCRMSGVPVTPPPTGIVWWPGWWWCLL